MALITLSTYLNDFEDGTDISDLDTDEENYFQNIVDAANDYFKEATDREIEQDTYTEIYSGSGTRFMYLKHYPIQSVSSVEGHNEGSIMVLEDRLYHQTGNFDIGQYNIEIEYTAGYSTIPSEVKNAVGELAKALSNQTDTGKGRLNIVSETRRDTDKDFNRDVVPKFTQEVIEDYKDKRKVIIDYVG